MKIDDYIFFSNVFRSVMFQTVRDIVWSMSNDELRTFVEKNLNKEIDGQLVVMACL